MTTATLRISAPLPEAETAPKGSLFRRFFEAMMEARMRQVERELRRHRHLVPENLRDDLGVLPFVRGA